MVNILAGILIIAGAVMIIGIIRDVWQVLKRNKWL